jgi:hypothetical protein
MRRIISYWAVTTALLCTAYFIYVRTLAPDELAMANTLPFQIIVSLIMVGGPCLVVLFLWLFFGSILRSLRSNRAPRPDAREASLHFSSLQSRAGGRGR